MKKAIIVSQNDQAANMITHALKSTGYLNISRFSAVCEARRYIMSILADIIIIESPFNDDGADFAIFAAEKTESVVILLCGRNIADELADKLSAYNILVLSNTISKRTLSDGIQLLSTDTAVPLNIRESEEVMRRIGDIRLINRAKSMLMKYLKFTEPQAHRYLEKQAMNNRCSRLDSAKKIISDLK